MTVSLELDDIQALVARGYGHLPAACFVLLEIADPNLVRGWIGSLCDQVTPADVKPGDRSLNVAFTSNGLQKLGVAPELLGMFSEEFISGMTAPHRQRILGDAGANAPEQWSWGGPETRPVDVLLMLYARDEPDLAALYAAQIGRLAAGGLIEVKRLDTVHLLDREHFGFRDGVSQPFVEGLSKTGPQANTVRAGEFILGYANEYGLYTDRPTLKAEADRTGLLPPDPSASGAVDFGRNGTYLVFRQLGQDVRGFWEFLDERTSDRHGASNAAARLRLAAKMIGRWPSGASLIHAPREDNPALAEANDFGYHHTDPHGFKCPIGSHVRRTHPRDALDPDPGSLRSIAIGNRHRILRRGRHYGQPLRPDELLRADGAADEDERGLYFIGLNANIARQFEFIQHTWVNNRTFNGLYDDADPLIASHQPHGATFTIQAEPVRERLTGLPQFVTVRGGAYFFLPGLRAIRYLASPSR